MIKIGALRHRQKDIVGYMTDDDGTFIVYFTEGESVELGIKQAPTPEEIQALDDLFLCKETATGTRGLSPIISTGDTTSFADSNGVTISRIVAEGAIVLDQELLRIVDAVIIQNPDLNLRKTSTIRVIEEQAELMIRKIERDGPRRFAEIYNNAYYTREITSEYIGYSDIATFIEDDAKACSKSFDILIDATISILKAAIKNGSKISDHLAGDAIDVTGDRPLNAVVPLFEAAGLKVLFEGDHLHLSRLK
jgi:hypothetical protein